MSVLYLTPIMLPLLTLDESTLFYWTLSDTSYKTQNRTSAINRWASSVGSIKSMSQSGAPKSTSSHAKTDIPSLTVGTSSRSHASSVLTDNVKIIAKLEAEPAVLSIHNNGGLSDNDEMGGEEQDFAIKSPPKGKRRITSKVFFFY